MTWICSNCGWKNDQDERIGRKKPICVRCKTDRSDGYELLDITNSEIAILEEKIGNIRTTIDIIRDNIHSLEDEINKEKIRINHYTDEYLEFSDILKTKRKNQNNLQVLLATKHHPTPDQTNLTAYV